jgi:hypothetical protein
MFLLVVLASSTWTNPARTDEVVGWSALDREVDALRASLESAPDGAHPEGPHLSGFLRGRFAWSRDVDASANPGRQELAGFTLDNVRLQLDGKAGAGVAYRVSLEAGDQAQYDTFGGPGVDLLDAYATIDLCPNAQLMVGQFCSAFLWGCCNSERDLLFLDRTFIDENWDNRDVGAQLVLTADRLHGWVAAQNGFDGQGSKQAYTARVAFDAFGEGTCTSEGRCGVDGDRLTLGAGWFDDIDLDKGRVVAADAHGVLGAFSAQAEIADYERDMRPGVAVNPATGALLPGTPTTTAAHRPWNATAAWLVVPDRWEVALRWQDLDDDAHTRIVSAGLNDYVAGREMRWTLQVDSAKSDDPALDVDAVSLGFTLAF